MSEVVVDTNVWVKVDEIVTEMKTAEERKCIESCQDWLEQFLSSDDRLVVDSFATYAIVTEYRRNVRPGGVAENLLNELTGRLFGRLVEKNIELDRNGIAILRPPFHLSDPEDRKFVAVAVQCQPFATIFNATDADWTQDRKTLTEHGLTINELCPDYIELIMTAP